MSLMHTRLVSFPALAGLALALCAGPLSAATIYQWKDAKGVTHYSDSPPPKGTYRDREVKDAKSTAPSATPATAPSATSPPAVGADCAQARLNRKHLQSGVPVGLDANRDGKLDAEMGAEERSKQLAQAEAAIARHCPGGT